MTSHITVTALCAPDTEVVISEGRVSCCSGKEIILQNGEVYDSHFYGDMELLVGERKKKIPDWRQRVIDELDDLNGKINRLINFATTKQFMDLSTSEQEAIYAQKHAMHMYSFILKNRIASFK